MPTIRQILYVSRPSTELTPQTVSSIVLKAQRANRQRDITGALAYSGSHFAQVLEGAPMDVADLMTKICGDKRHSDFSVVLDRAIDQRDFAQWAMGFIYDASLDEEIGLVLDRALKGAVDDIDPTLPLRLFAHVTDLANP